jgi:hypothetical protein
MALADYKLRIIASACVTRYDGGERALEDIVSSYNLAPEDHTAVLALAMAKRPDAE